MRFHFLNSVKRGEEATNPDLSTASFDNISFNVGSQDINNRGIAFSNDGTKMYIIGRDNLSVFQYTLSTAWDLSTASFDNISFGVGSEDGDVTGVTFSNDGTKMYMIGRAGDAVYPYTLSTAWDLSTASYDSVSFGVGSEETSPFDVAFSNDGTKMYMVGLNTDTVYQYSLSTAWDLSTASFDNISFDFTSEDINPVGVAFSNDGTKMYMLGFDSDFTYQYTLSTAWDLSTASFDNISFGVGSEETSPFDVAFSNDGTKMYMVGLNTDTVYQYSV